MKDKIMSAITDAELNEIGTEISVRNLDNQSELFNLISERRKQLNDVMAEIGEMTLSDVVGDVEYE